MATFRFELNGRPTRNKTYVVYLRVTVSGKRKLIKTPIEVGRPSDFNAKCKGENWIRGGVRDAKLLNAQLADILAKAKETYKELDKEGEVSTVLLAKEMNTEVVSPSFMAFARERAQMIYDNGGWRNWRKYCGLINKLEAFHKKRRMADITIADLTVDLLTKFDNFLHKWKMNENRVNCCIQTRLRYSSIFCGHWCIEPLRSESWMLQRIPSSFSNTKESRQRRRNLMMTRCSESLTSNCRVAP
ncbi:MAG: phage integrase SAM-like domain and Arm DNA-binding domain-containing protein [Muribaculum sp.]|nr:phage integrase SAM-like domain and Arm DNA-binding domain-containing protein [Muribaculum sp.]